MVLLGSALLNHPCVCVNFMPTKIHTRESLGLKFVYLQNKYCLDSSKCNPTGSSKYLLPISPVYDPYREERGLTPWALSCFSKLNSPFGMQSYKFQSLDAHSEKLLKCNFVSLD